MDVRPHAETSGRKKIYKKTKSVQPERENRNCLKRKGTTKMELKRSCRKDKDQIDEIANKLEAAAERRDVRKYNVTRRLSGNKTFRRRNHLEIKMASS